MLNGGRKLVGGGLMPPSISLRGLRAPALVVGFAGLLAIGRRPNHDADLGLLVALDGGFPGAAVLLAPHQRQLGARLRVLLLDETEREHLALVPGIAGEHR